jgi:Zinc carboxypeptidase/Carboxypeptidase regulatory-like domain/FlgD Ig-like domain
MRNLCLLFTLLIFRSLLFAQTEEHYFRFAISDMSEIDQITRMISIDKIDRKYVYGYANDRQWFDINSKGFEIERLPHPGSLYQHKMANTVDEIQEWDTYPSYPLYKSMMRQYADSFPQICRLDTIGYSVHGKLLLAVKISDNVDAEEDEPEFFYTSTMHGDETVGYVLMLRLIDYLLSQYGENTPEGTRVTNLVNNMEIWINPLANPDGTFRIDTLNVNSAWRYNANAVDLNRDFPDRITDPINTPDGREPETQAMMYLAADHNFNMSANFHGGAQVVNYPWDNGAPSGIYSACPDDAWFIDICLEYASTNQDMLNGGFPNGITNGCDWYSIFGGRQDWIYYWHGGRETTIELWDSKNPIGSVLPQRWTNNKESFLSYMEQTFQGIRGIVTDASTGEPILAQIDVDGFAAVPVYTDPDVGDFHRMLLPGTYTVYFRAPYYKADTLHNITVSDTGATRVNVALQELASIVNNSKELPQEFSLSQNYPNPFNPSTTIQYSVPYVEEVKLTVYNALAEKVKILLDRQQKAGDYNVVWDGKNGAGEPMATGIYFCRMQASEFTFTRKMILLR